MPELNRSLDWLARKPVEALPAVARPLEMFHKLLIILFKILNLALKLLNLS
jgi:hypothetical protein